MRYSTDTIKRKELLLFFIFYFCIKHTGQYTASHLAQEIIRFKDAFVVPNDGNYLTSHEKF